MLTPRGWPGHKGQGLREIRAWQRVSSRGPTAPLLPCAGLATAFPFPPCCRGGRGAGVPSQPRSPRSALLQRSPEGSPQTQREQGRRRRRGQTSPAWSSRARQQPMATEHPGPYRLPSCPCKCGRPGLEPRSLSPRAVPTSPPDVWARARPSSPRAGWLQEQSSARPGPRHLGLCREVECPQGVESQRAPQPGAGRAVGRCSRRPPGPASRHRSSAHPEHGREGAGAAPAGQPSVPLGGAAHGRCCWPGPAPPPPGLQPWLPTAEGPQL